MAKREGRLQVIMRGPNDRKLSSTLTKNLSMFKFVESGQESTREPRVHERSRPNENESPNSHPRFARALNHN